MITSERYLSICKINSPEAKSTRYAYDLGKYIASQKTILNDETQKIFDNLMKNKISINISKVQNALKEKTL